MSRPRPVNSSSNRNVATKNKPSRTAPTMRATTTSRIFAVLRFRAGGVHAGDTGLARLGSLGQPFRLVTVLRGVLGGLVGLLGVESGPEGVLAGLLLER